MGMSLGSLVEDEVVVPRIYFGKAEVCSQSMRYPLAINALPFEMTSKFYVGQRLSYQKALCTVRYVGLVDGTEKEWLGVEWDDPLRGKHDGELKGKRYFSCKYHNGEKYSL